MSDELLKGLITSGPLASALAYAVYRLWGWGRLLLAGHEAKTDALRAEHRAERDAMRAEHARALEAKDATINELIVKLDSCRTHFSEYVSALVERLSEGNTHDRPHA